MMLIKLKQYTTVVNNNNSNKAMWKARVKYNITVKYMSHQPTAVDWGGAGKPMGANDFGYQVEGMAKSA